jgi:hypothetical protein
MAVTKFVAPGQDGADLGVGERLVDLHARAPGIGKDDLDAFPFEGFDEDVASEHQFAHFLLRRGGLGLLGRCLAHVLGSFDRSAW